MGASITLAGESLIAQKQGTQQLLDITRFVLAYIPGLDTTLPIDRAAGLPDAAQIVHTQEVTREGYLTPNQVVYSLMLGSDIGDFDFNWIGLQSAEDVLVIAASLPRQQKRRELPPVQSGNNLTRNIVLEYDGAQGLTGIDVPASTWQFDFSAQFATINEKLAQIQADLDKKIDESNWNPPQAVSLDGPNLVYVGSSNTYKITDFSRFSVFSATTTVGTVTIAGDTLTLTIPTPSTAVVATLEVRRDDAVSKFQIPIGAATILAPKIISPADQATGVSLDLVLTTSAFEVYPAGYDKHLNTRWQVALDAAFTQIVFDKTSTTELTSIRPSDYDVLLSPGKRHYARAYHNGNTLQSGAPVATTFNTATSYIRRPAITFPTDGQTRVSKSVTILSDAFSVYGGNDTHVQSRFQITSVTSGLVVFDSGWTSASLTSFKPSSALVVAQQFDARVKYKGQTLGESEWSPSVRFTTARDLAGTYTARAGGATVRNSAAGDVVSGAFYVSGGNNSGTILADLWKYNPVDNTWAQKTSAPVRSQSHTLTAVDGKLYMFGGSTGVSSGNGTQSSLYVYDPVLDTWKVRTAGLASMGHCAAAWGGKVYVFGGRNDTDYYSKSLRAYDTLTNSWKYFNVAAGAPSPLMCLDGSMVAIDGVLYLYGGINSGGVHFDELWSYTIATDTWKKLASGPVKVDQHVAVAYEGKMYLFGGSTIYGDVTNGIVASYDPQSNTWETLPSMSPRSYAVAGVIDASVFIYSGLVPSFTAVNTLVRVD